MAGVVGARKGEVARRLITVHVPYQGTLAEEVESVCVCEVVGMKGVQKHLVQKELHAPVHYPTAPSYSALGLHYIAPTAPIRCIIARFQYMAFVCVLAQLQC